MFLFVLFGAIITFYYLCIKKSSFLEINKYCNKQINKAYNNGSNNSINKQGNQH